MLKKLIASFLTLTLLFLHPALTKAEKTSDENIPFLEETDQDFTDMNDPAFLQYVQDSIYAQIDADNADQDATIIIDDINTVYISKEYLEEVAYNTKANIYFGYNLAQLNEVFEGKKYVFTLGDNGETAVHEYLEIPDNTNEILLKNVLIGSGIILVCVTATIISAGMATPLVAGGAASASAIAATAPAQTALKVGMIFASSAKTAAAYAGKVAALAGAAKFITRGLETGWDMDVVPDAALLQASEGLKWGAISGTIAGGAKEALRLYEISSGAINCREAERAALEAYGGRSQVSYYNGEEVKMGLGGSVRPDVVVGNEALEVKCYDLTHEANLSLLKSTLTKEIRARIKHLPANMTQRIVLNVEGRGYTRVYVEKVVQWIHEFMQPIYPDIPIDVMGGML